MLPGMQLTLRPVRRCSPRRQGDSGGTAGDDAWLLSSATEREAEVRLGSLGITVPLAEIYAGIELPHASPAR